MSEQRKSPWGTIDRLPSGRFRLRGYLEGRERTVGTFDGLDEALGAALEVKRRREGKAPGLTVEAWGRRWLKLRRRAGRHRAVKTTALLWTSYVDGSSLGAMLLRDVKPKHVSRWLHELALRPRKADADKDGPKRTLSHSTLRNARTALSVAMRDAVIAGHRDTNPVIGVVLPRPEARIVEEWTFLSEVELLELLGHEELQKKKNARLRRILTIAAFTGLRSGELWGLRWADVHLGADDAHLIVRFGDSKGGPTKSGRPRRVDLLPPARDALLELRDEGGVTRAGAGHVFVGRRGPHARSYDAGWAKTWREALGARPAIVFHSFRHTFASHLVMGTWGRAWRLEEVQQVLGHTKITTTERYAHLAPEGMKRTIDEARSQWTGPDLGTTRRTTRPRRLPRK